MKRTTTDAKPGDLVTDRLGSPTAAGNSATEFTITVVGGPDAGKQVRVELETPGRTYAGTSATCHLVLSDRAVSRRHLALELSGAVLRVTDLGSTNGTVVNGANVIEALAGAGDMIRIGESVLRVDASPVARPRLSPATSFGRFVGASDPIRRLFPLFERLAAADVPILVEGEAGTGKELLAEAIHETSARNAGPFVVVDCSSLATALADAELFGDGASAGALARASGGTLVLEHVSELDGATQAKLARAIPAGPAAASAARVMATSRLNLDKEVETGRFREDLYFRLAVGKVELPPLRRRPDDVRLLAEYFWKKLDPSGRPLPVDFLRRHEGHGWPGNVRELEAAVARRIAYGDFDVDVEASPPEGAPANAFVWLLSQDLAFPTARRLLLSEFERVFVDQALAKHGGNISRAAAASGLARRYFQIMRSRIGR